MTLEERVVELERIAAANQIPASLAQLQRKLEQDWQPEASLLLEPGSISADMLADASQALLLALGIARGTSTATWTASPASAATNVAHGLGVTPASVQLTAEGTANLVYNVTSRDATNVVVTGQHIPGTNVSGTFTFNWTAFV